MHSLRSILVLCLLSVMMGGIAHAQWVQTDGPYTDKVFAFAISGINLFAGASGGVFLSTNNGSGWSVASTGLTNSYVKSLAVSGTNLFAGTYGGGAFLSTNNGTTWSAVNTGLTDTYVNALAASGTNLFAGTFGGVFLSTNNGTSWTQVNTGLTSSSVLALAFSPNGAVGTNLFAGTDGRGIWKRPLSEMITSAEELSTDLPAQFLLDQNHPNPFNPSTTIRYSLPRRARMTLSVWNTLGQQIAVLHNGEQDAGYYELRFDGSGLSSGVYFYRIQAGEFVQTRKLLLQR
jgi:hypothetical protein